MYKRLLNLPSLLKMKSHFLFGPRMEGLHPRFPPRSLIADQTQKPNLFQI